MSQSPAASRATKGTGAYYAAAALAIALFGIGPYLVFHWTPMQVEPLFFNQKIFYYHVPCGFMQFAAVFVCGIWSIKYLRKRDGRHDDVARAAGDVALLFSIMLLVSGSIWAKVAWGAWWVWDERLTTSLLLTTVMAGYVLVRRFGGAGSERLAAGLAIFGMADVPLIYFSVRIWDDSGRQHPKTDAVPTLSGEMRTTFWLMVLAYLAFFLLLLMSRINAARTERILHETREAALDGGLL
jgi:heme exporter protein C